MNGDGWVCDECDEKVVVPGIDRLVGNVPPRGWFVLNESPGVRDVASRRWDFCSIDCAMNATTKLEAERAHEQSVRGDKTSPSARTEDSDA